MYIYFFSSSSAPIPSISQPFIPSPSPFLATAVVHAILIKDSNILGIRFDDEKWYPPPLTPPSLRPQHGSTHQIEFL